MLIKWKLQNKIKKAQKVCIPDNEFVKYYLENPNITWDIIEANLDKEWDYSKLS